MKSTFIYLHLFLLFLLFSCKQKSSILSNKDENQLILAAIHIEKDSSLGKIDGAKYGSYYLLNNRYQDTVYIGSNVVNLLKTNFDLKDIQEQYKNILNTDSLLHINGFDLIQIVEFSNKTPNFLSFSKPIKLLKYYIINFSYFSWASGYKSVLIFEKKATGEFRLVYRKVYQIV